MPRIHPLNVASLLDPAQRLKWPDWEAWRRPGEPDANFYLCVHEDIQCLVVDGGWAKDPSHTSYLCARFPDGTIKLTPGEECWSVAKLEEILDELPKHLEDLAKNGEEL